ncbi:hypothetical protein ACFP56_04675 [Paenibacillus septentrionalis]|uniref:Uncharacterized protein n=1 Tax=Paenibacillus septentrionalis TaxID=429342 RepID=A0ABW1V0B6_9BACL
MIIFSFRLIKYRVAVIVVYFIHFLPDTIESTDQQAAFEDMISFFDDTASLSYPAQEKSKLDNQQAFFG